jgi:hypothetical protein
MSDDKRQKLFREDFSWAFLYELSYLQHLLLYLAAFGALSVAEAAAKNSACPGDSVWNALRDFDRSDTFDGDWKGGDGGLFDAGDVMSLVIANVKQIESLGKMGKYLSELVQDVREGREESFFQAIHIDPTIMTCETFAAYMSRKHLSGGDEFFRLLGNALKTKWAKPMASHFDLRVLLQAALEGGLLEKLSSMTKADLFFIRELRAYSDRGEDPARGLQRFISRWKTNKFNK